MEKRVRFAVGLAVVLASMALLLTAPQSRFIDLTFLSTGCMIVAALALGGYRSLFEPTRRSLAVGLASAAALYGLFYAGAAAISALHPLGIGPSSETSIYSLIASPSNPFALQAGVLLFDAVGYESYFRGVLQRSASARLGLAAPFAVAAADAMVHAVSLNLLWVVTTFVVDSVWGLVYYYTKDLTSSLASHFVWDIAIFILFPIH